MSALTDAVELPAGHLVRGDVVVTASGAAWTVEAFSSFEDRDGRLTVAATGRDSSGQRFALQKRANRPVRVRAR